MPEAVVRWDPDQGGLVGADGEPVTNGQASKARRYNDGGLVELVDQSLEGGAYVRTFAVDPLPSCSMSYPVTVSEAEGTRWYTCQCQRARSTARTDAGLCSHVLAVAAHLEHVDLDDRRRA